MIFPTDFTWDYRRCSSLLCFRSFFFQSTTTKEVKKRKQNRKKSHKRDYLYTLRKAQAGRGRRRRSVLGLKIGLLSHTQERRKEGKKEIGCFQALVIVFLKWRKPFEEEVEEDKLVVCVMRQLNGRFLLLLFATFVVHLRLKTKENILNVVVVVVVIIVVITFSQSVKYGKKEEEEEEVENE